jgi:hypothetical protein
MIGVQVAITNPHPTHLKNWGKLRKLGEMAEIKDERLDMSRKQGGLRKCNGKRG